MTSPSAPLDIDIRKLQDGFTDMIIHYEESQAKAYGNRKEMEKVLQDTWKEFYAIVTPYYKAEFTRMLEGLREQGVFVTYKEDGGHGIAIPNGVIDELIKELK